MIRDESVRLFMNADEVFKVWEENMRLADEETPTSRKQSSIFGGGASVRKNASLHERENRQSMRLRKLHQRAQSTDVAPELESTAADEPGSLVSGSALKLSTGSMPSEVLMASRQQQTPRSVSFKSSQHSLAEFPRRRFSGLSSGAAEAGGGGPEIRRVALDNDYKLLREIGAGQFGAVQLAEHRQSRQRICLKFFARPHARQLDFFREYEIARFLSPHPYILDTFEGCFETDDESAYFFVQEHVPNHTLRDLLNSHPGGLGETASKAIVTKLLAALEFMHLEGLVHRNIRAENVIVCDPGKFTRVKLTEFGLTRPVDSSVRHTELVSSYHAPELCEKVPNETFHVAKSTDVWAMGVLVAYCVKGKFPWQKATIMCKPFYEWDQWLKRKAIQQPKYWDTFSDKSMRMFKHTLNPKPKERWEVKDMRKLVEKERLMKSKASPDDQVYYPEEEESSSTKSTTAEAKQPKKSVIGQWINNTLNTMSEISEQVVSARDDD